MKAIKDLSLNDVSGTWVCDHYNLIVCRNTNKVEVCEREKNVTIISEPICMEYLLTDKSTTNNTMRLSENIVIWSISGFDEGRLIFDFGRGYVEMIKA